MFHNNGDEVFLISQYILGRLSCNGTTPGRVQKYADVTQGNFDVYLFVSLAVKVRAVIRKGGREGRGGRAINIVSQNDVLRPVSHLDLVCLKLPVGRRLQLLDTTGILK